MSHKREDKYVELPDDAIVLLDTEAVNRSVYEDAITTLAPDLKQGEDDRPDSLVIRKFYRHILVRRDRALEFLGKVQMYLTSRGVHPDIKLDVLEANLKADSVKRDIADKRQRAVAEEQEWKRDFITRSDRYVYYYSRWRRLYSKIEDKLVTDLTADSTWYVRKGRGGMEEAELPFVSLKMLSYQSVSDARISYE